jgi:hypothetical protein
LSIDVKSGINSECHETFCVYLATREHGYNKRF